MARIDPLQRFHGLFRPKITRILSLVLVATLSSVTAEASQGEWINLTDGYSFSDVQDYILTPDGRYVVYTHDPTVDGAFELYRVSVFGDEPIRLSGLLPSGSSVEDFAVTPDGSHVVYLAPENSVDVDELFSVAIDGGPRVRLNGDLASGGTVTAFKLSPDGTRVVYNADQDTVRQLYSVPAGGGVAIRLNGDLPPGGNVGSSTFKISPNGSHVVYHADERTDGVWELFSVPLSGGSSVPLNGAVVAGGGIVASNISPNSDRVVYIADQQTENVFELYSVPIIGGDEIKLSTPSAMDVEDFLISPDGATVVFRRDYLDENYELYSVPIAGGSQVKLEDIDPGDLGVESDYRISADSQRVVYRLTALFPEVIATVYSVPTTGGSRVRLNGTLTTGGHVYDFAITPDSSRVVYLADQTIDGWPMGYRVDVEGPTGSDEAIWTRPLVDDHPYVIDATSSFVIVIGSVTFGDSIERLWKVRLVGVPDVFGEELIPGSDFHPDGNVSSFILGPGNIIVYRADQIIDDRFELFAYHPPLFADGFESGDLDAWSASSP